MRFQLKSLTRPYFFLLTLVVKSFKMVVVIEKQTQRNYPILPFGADQLYPSLAREFTAEQYISPEKPLRIRLPLYPRSDSEWSQRTSP